MGDGVPNGGAARPPHGLSPSGEARTDTRVAAPFRGTGSAFAGLSASGGGSASSGRDSGHGGEVGEAEKSERCSGRGEGTTDTAGANEGDCGDRATPASKDAWSCLRGKMCLEEILFETSQRAKVYNRNHYGLLGILKVIRMTDPDLNVLALGTDLTSLGLNLNSPECLFSSFGSPWSDAPAARDAESLLPSCYLPPVPPVFKLSHLERFHEHTLFYIFYCCPRLLLQGCAAAELYNRSWQYHKAWKKWFLADSVARGTGRTGGGGAEMGGKEAEGTVENAAGSRPGDGAAAADGTGKGADAGGGGSRETVKREFVEGRRNGESDAACERAPGDEGRDAGEDPPRGLGTNAADLPRWIYFEPATWDRREFRGVLDLQFFLKAEEVRQSVEEGVRQVRAQQQLQQQQLQQLQQQHQQQVSVQHPHQASVQHPAPSAAHHQHFPQHQKPSLTQPSPQLHNPH